MTPAQITTALYTIVRKDTVRIVRLWKQTFLPSVVTSVLYFTVFGTFIGSQLAHIGGFSYIQFIVPGLVMMSVITNSYSSTSSAFFQAKFTRSIEELLVSPMPDWILILGFTLAGVVRGTIVGALVLASSLFFTHLVIFNALVLIAAFIITCVLFSLAGILNALFAETFDGISIIPTFVLTPLTYLGGVFYSVHNLPQFWQTVSLGNPILYMVNTFRYGFLGISDVNLTLSFGILIALTVAFMGTLVILMKKGIGLKN